MGTITSNKTREILNGAAKKRTTPFHARYVPAAFPSKSGCCIHLGSPCGRSRSTLSRGGTALPGLLSLLQRNVVVIEDEYGARMPRKRIT